MKSETLFFLILPLPLQQPPPLPARHRRAGDTSETDTKKAGAQRQAEAGRGLEPDAGPGVGLPRAAVLGQEDLHEDERDGLVSGTQWLPAEGVLRCGPLRLGSLNAQSDKLPPGDEAFLELYWLLPVCLS